MMPSHSSISILTAIVLPLYILAVVAFFALIVVGLVRLIKWLKVSCEESTKVRLELGKLAEEISLIRKAQTPEEPTQESS